MTEKHLSAPLPKLLRIVTYNVHSCRGTDGSTDPERIAEIIARHAPDIAALQEVDVGRARSGGADQAERIAEHLRMTSHFHPALHLESEQYGDAILTALPSRLVRAGPLPSIGEPRGAIRVAVETGGIELQVINTHLGLRRRERKAQLNELLGPDWLGSAECREGPAIFLGDLNAIPASALYRELARNWQDVQAGPAGRPRPTFPSRFPFLRLDYIFVSRDIRVLNAKVQDDPATRAASDHLPVSATIALPERREINPAEPRPRAIAAGSIPPRRAL